MDALHITYFEETEELLQKAEECLIRLESEYSSDDINELFRIAHSIKGSSQMIGFDLIGNLTHKIEDLLDLIRKGRLGLDRQVLKLCFDGMDCVKTMVEAKKGMSDESDERETAQAAEKLKADIDRILRTHAEEKSAREPSAPTGGIIGAMRDTAKDAKRRVYISIMFSDDVPMVQPLLFMIFNNIKEIGSLSYSSVSDDDIFAASPNRRIASCSMILNTDMEASELYPYFEMMYVDHVSIVDITDGNLREQTVSRDGNTVAFYEWFFHEYKKLHPLICGDHGARIAELRNVLREQSEHLRQKADTAAPVHAVRAEIERFYEWCLFLMAGRTKLTQPLKDMLRRDYLRLFDLVYGHVRGKILYKIVRAREHQLLKQLTDMAERMDRTLIRSLLVHVGDLGTVEESALAYLIRLKRDLQEAGISVAIIAGTPLNRRMVNIFDAIQSIERFDVFATERDAVLGHR
jgi:HPt (histidine-containing phosphotransfer) domain-containing protein